MEINHLPFNEEENLIKPEKLKKIYFMYQGVNSLINNQIGILSFALNKNGKPVILFSPVKDYEVSEEAFILHSMENLTLVSKAEFKLYESGVKK